MTHQAGRTLSQLLKFLTNFLQGKDKTRRQSKAMPSYTEHLTMNEDKKHISR